MSLYNIYPGVDEQYRFAPEVRQAIASSTEVDAAISVNVAEKVAPLVASYIGSNPAVVDAAAAAVNANPALTSLQLNALQFKPVPPGAVSTWTGTPNAGIYRLPIPAAVDAIPDRPVGSGPAIVTVVPAGSSASLVTWEEFLPPFRKWDRVIMTGFNANPGWRIQELKKRVLISQTVAGGSLATAMTDFGGRLLVDYGVTIHRFRVGMQNKNFRFDITYPEPITLAGLSIGEARENPDGSLSGQWVIGTGEFIDGEQEILNGDPYYSPWFEYTLDSSKKYLLSYGVRAAPGQVVHHGLAPVWKLSGSAAVHSESNVGVADDVAPLDVWIEAEVPQNTRVEAVFGDSLSVGNSSSHPVHDSWLAMHCRANGSLPMFAAASGDSMASYTDPLAPKLSRFAGFAKPDVLHWAMGSNNVFAVGQTLLMTQDNFKAAWKPVTEALSKNVVLHSILPRLDNTNPGELVRRQYNEWLETTLPGMSTLYIDTAASVIAANGTEINTKWTQSPTNFHLSTPGYARMASAMR